MPAEINYDKLSQYNLTTDSNKSLTTFLFLSGFPTNTVRALCRLHCHFKRLKLK